MVAPVAAALPAAVMKLEVGAEVLDAVPVEPVGAVTVCRLRWWFGAAAARGAGLAYLPRGQEAAM